MPITMPVIVSVRLYKWSVCVNELVVHEVAAAVMRKGSRSHSLPSHIPLAAPIPPQPAHDEALPCSLWTENAAPPPSSTQPRGEWAHAAQPMHDTAQCTQEIPFKKSETHVWMRVRQQGARWCAVSPERLICASRHLNCAESLRLGATSMPAGCLIAACCCPGHS